MHHVVLQAEHLLRDTDRGPGTVPLARDVIFFNFDERRLRVIHSNISGVEWPDTVSGKT